MVYIGIDIAKRSHTALALTADRDIVGQMCQATNDRDGFSIAATPY